MNDEHFHSLLHSVINALDGLTKATREAHSEKQTNAILHRLAEMEQRLTDAIAKKTEIDPSLEAAAMKVQSALDKLDATIPDKKES